MTGRGAHMAIAVLLVLLLLPTQAGAAELVHPDGSPWGGHWQQVVDHLKAPTYDGKVLFLAGHGAECDPGCARAGCDQSWAEPDDCEDLPRIDTFQPNRAVLAHELGHVADFGSPRGSGWRTKFRKIFGRERDPWWSKQRPLGEWLAEAYRGCATWKKRPGRKRFSSLSDGRARFSYRYRPSPTQQRRVCRLIKEIG